MPPADPALFSPSHLELALHAYVSSTRYNHVLKVLTNLCAMKEQKFKNHHLIYKPVQPANLPPSQVVHYIQLWSRVEDEPSSPPAEGEEQEQQPKVYDPRQQNWIIRVDDLPEVNQKPVVSRTVLSANTGTGDVMGFVELMGYVMQASYFTDNLRFVLGNVVLQMSQILVPNWGPPDQAPPPQMVPGQIGDPYHPDGLRKVDESGGWMMEAHVKVGNNNDVAAVDAAVKELEYVKDQLAGVVGLTVVERLAFDTRCKT